MSSIPGNLPGAPLLTPRDLAPLPGTDPAAQASQAAAAAAALLVDQKALELALLSVGTSPVRQAQVGQPELPKVLLDLLPKGMSADDLQILAASVFSDCLDSQSKVTGESLLAKKDELAKTNADRLAKLLEAQQKAKDAEPGFWGKLLGWVGKIVTAVVSVVSLVVGALVAATGVGIGVGVALMALGGYMMAGLVVEAIDAVREKQGLEPLGWSPTLGQLAKVIAGALGASEEVQYWIKMGVDIVTDLVVGIAAAILLPGAGALITAEKFGKAAKFCQQIVAVIEKSMTSVTEAKKLQQAAGVIQAGMSLAQGGMGISTGIKTHDATTTKAEVKELMGKLMRLQAMFDSEVAMLEKTEETRSAALKRCSDSVAQTGEAAAAVTANMAMA